MSKKRKLLIYLLLTGLIYSNTTTPFNTTYLQQFIPSPETTEKLVLSGVGIGMGISVAYILAWAGLLAWGMRESQKRLLICLENRNTAVEKLKSTVVHLKKKEISNAINAFQEAEKIISENFKDRGVTVNKGLVDFAKRFEIANITNVATHATLTGGNPDDYTRQFKLKINQYLTSAKNAIETLKNKLKISALFFIFNNEQREAAIMYVDQLHWVVQSSISCY